MALTLLHGIDVFRKSYSLSAEIGKSGTFAVALQWDLAPLVRWFYVLWLAKACYWCTGVGILSSHNLSRLPGCWSRRKCIRFVSTM